ncbi:DUF6968 family protein [Sorangium cellulosum]|uniref:DUF6968 family protein n=1 Tax=Sorangium cellulosum TaxID=56 RepID=UPI0012DB15ED|nr:hypothetical protein [Sorangium cellulosum]
MSEEYTPIAVRRYSVEGQPEREIVLKIGQPFQVSPPGVDWACPVVLEGLGDGHSKCVYGIDGVQAIQLAIQYARIQLEASGLPLLWMSEEPGDLGLPRAIESTVGLWFQRELEKIVEKEQRRMHEIVIELGKVRERRRGSTGP